MNPLFLLLTLVWSSCLVTIIVAAMFYANADQVMVWLETHLTPAAVKSLNDLSDRSRHTVDRLSQIYLQDVKRLFQHRPRRESNDQEE